MTKKPIGIDHIARWTAILSAVIAFAGVFLQTYISNKALKEQALQFQIQQSEKLSVSLDPNGNGYFKITDNNLGPLGHIVQFTWGLWISNIGNQKLSVTHLSLKHGNPPNQMFYSGIMGEIFTDKAEKVSLPITLESGESRHFYIYVGLPVPPSVKEILGEIEKTEEPTIGHARKQLAFKGLDFFGNQVVVSKYPDNSFSISQDPKNSNFPTIWLSVTTGRNSEFFTSATPYRFPHST